MSEDGVLSMLVESCTPGLGANGISDLLMDICSRWASSARRLPLRPLRPTTPMTPAAHAMTPANMVALCIFKGGEAVGPSTKAPWTGICHEKKIN